MSSFPTLDRLSAVVDPLRGVARLDMVLLVALVLMSVDAALAVRYWQWESNPLLRAVGPAAMVAVKSTAATGIAAVWFGWDGVQEFRAARWCVWFLFALYSAVLVTNLAVLLLFA
ncbi:hypothetical protein [Haloarcula pellucida]|uniref:DUF5658 domain-containing protein n=1 Tax=Haloarcula pellucida TaxID=1427151 RepID=A0A830GKF3_9EURY|nr:hypothetical protein [Halomicroarcula pellucida]MBX0348659.1 hypothetical protein [Halomicroarcula pellucida]GGN92346.1 hypothetical protein GCM10009030_16510 [Halomicroarcula pellucida]